MGRMKGHKFFIKFWSTIWEVAFSERSGNCERSAEQTSELDFSTMGTGSYLRATLVAISVCGEL